MAANAKEWGWYLDEQLLITGAPRFDFYTDPWRDAGLRISSYADSLRPPVILINGSFPLSNPRFKTREGEAEMLINRLGFDEDYVRRWQQMDGEALLAFVEVANHLAGRFPGVNFVYRPHPFEKPETYHDLLESRENLRLDGSGTVDGWILRARAVIQRNSSTAIEAGMAGVLALSAAWIPVVNEVPFINAASVACESQEAMDEWIEKLLQKEEVTPPEAVMLALDEITRDWFYAIDGNSHERVASAILAHAGAGQQATRLKRCRERAYSQGTSFKSRIGATARKTLGLSMHWSFSERRNLLRYTNLDVWENSAKVFDANQVQTLIAAIDASARSGMGGARSAVGVQPAQARGDYHFGYLNGRSVAICSQ